MSSQEIKDVKDQYTKLVRAQEEVYNYFILEDIQRAQVEVNLAIETLGTYIDKLQ